MNKRMTNTKITKKNEKEKKMTNTKITKKNEKEKKMKKEMIFKEIKRVEQNPFANPRKANNGGGYFQPRIDFTFRGVKGFISDTSCGDFGDRVEIVWGNKEYYYDSVSREEEEYSTFSKFKPADLEAAKEIKKHTGYKVCFKEDILEDQEYIDEDVIVDRNLSKGWKRKRHEATKN